MKLFLIGYRCTGKTTIGKALAKTLNLGFIDLDALIVQKRGRRIDEIVAEHGWPYFRALERQVLDEVINRSDSLVVSCGGGVVLHEEALPRVRASGFVVWLKAGVSTIVQRLLNDPVTGAQRPALVHGMSLEDEVKHTLAQRLPLYEKWADFSVHTDQMALQDVLQEIILAVGDIKQIVKKFVEQVKQDQIEIYNEISLQHEFGLYLRSMLHDMKVQFERPVSFFFKPSHDFIKKEIDISIFSPDKTEKKAAIELKFPRRGQYPEQMFSFCKDICFLEQLKQRGFNAGYFIVFVDDRLFYEGPSTDGIYKFFRAQQPLTGVIQKPTGKRDEGFEIAGEYRIQWQDVNNHGLKYAMVEI